MTEVQRLAKIMILKDMRKEYELRAKYNGGVDYDCYRALDMAIEKLEQEPCTQEKQANADKIDAVYIDGFKAGYSQARFDLKQEPCTDCISRKTVAEILNHQRFGISKMSWDIISEKLSELPPVTPTEKVGQWIEQIDHEENCRTLICSNCDRPALHDGDSIWKHKFCPHCGAKMQGVEE